MFNKNKRKTDSKIRYRTSHFSRKLESARGYKRVVRQRPKNSWEVFFASVGLATWQSKVITAAIFFLLIYIVYIPNFLFIKQVTVNGSDSSANGVVKTLTDSYLGKKLPWPQRNLLLLSKGKLASYLLDNTQKVLSVDTVSKKFPNRLTVSVTPRLDSFLIETASSTLFTVSNDGLITGVSILDASSTLPNLSFLIKLDSGENLITGQQALSLADIAFLNQVRERLPGIIKSEIDYYEMAEIPDESVTVYTKSGYKILFDLNSDPGQSLDRLNLLLSQFSATDAKKIYYIDMRFKDKGYVCNKGTLCVQNVVLPTSSATSTSTSTPQ